MFNRHGTALHAGGAPLTHAVCLHPPKLGAAETLRGFRACAHLRSPSCRHRRAPAALTTQSAASAASCIAHLGHLGATGAAGVLPRQAGTCRPPGHGPGPPAARLRWQLRALSCTVATLALRRVTLAQLHTCSMTQPIRWMLLDGQQATRACLLRPLRCLLRPATHPAPRTGG